MCSFNKLRSFALFSCTAFKIRKIQALSALDMTHNVLKHQDSDILQFKSRCSYDYTLSKVLCSCSSYLLQVPDVKSPIDSKQVSCFFFYRIQAKEFPKSICLQYKWADVCQRITVSVSP